MSPQVTSTLFCMQKRTSKSLEKKANIVISVIVPAYNAAKFLPKSIESILNQTYKNVEVTVVDDGSTDNTELVVKKYPVEYIKIEHTGGAAIPRNVGVKNAKGELVAFLDADDIWLPKKLEEELKFMQRGKFDLVHCDGEVIDEFGKTIRKTLHKDIKVPSGKVFADLYRGNFIVTSSVIVKRTCFDKVGLFDKKMHVVEDYDLWLRMAQMFRLGYLNKRLLKYRDYEGSFSDEGTIRNHERLLNVVLKHHPYAKKQLGKESRLKIYNLCRFLTRNSKRNNLFKYLKYKIMCFVYFQPSGIRQGGLKRSISEIRELVAV